MFPNILRIAFQLVVTGFASLLGIVIYQELSRPKNMPPYPGGKRPLPLLGHILQLPKEKSWMAFRKWHQMYGPILTIWNGNTPIVLIGDANVSTCSKHDFLISMVMPLIDCSGIVGAAIVQV